MKPLLTLGISLLMSSVLFAQQPNEKVQAAIDAGVLDFELEVYDLVEPEVDYMNFASENVFRIFPYSKADDPTTKSASELTSLVTGEAITSADLVDFNPLLFNVDLLQKEPQYFAIDANTTLMLLSDERLEELFKRDQINRQAAAKRSEK